MVWNARSLNNKIESFIQSLEDNDIQIGAVGETWFGSSNNYVTAYLRDHGYNIHHQHRETQKGGGVSIIFSNSITRDQSRVHTFSSFECVSVTFSGLNGNKLVFVVVYRLGDVPMSIFLTEFNEFVEYLHFAFTNFILCGDFNIHCNDLLNPDVIKFYGILNSFNLNQFVNEPTHVMGNTLDLVICNPVNVPITNLNVCSDTPSDHFIVYFSINFAPNLNEPKVVRSRKLHKDHENDFKQDLETKLEEFRSQNVSTCFKETIDTFNQIQFDVFNKYAPETEKVQYNTTKPKWMDKEFKVARADRRKKFKKWRRTNDENDREIFVHSRATVAQLVHTKKKSYYSALIANCDNSQRALFKVCNDLLDKPKCGILPKTNSPHELADRFNNYFCDKIAKIRSNFTSASSIIMQDYYAPTFPSENSTLKEFEPLTEPQLLKIIKSAPIKTSPDDPIPAIVLKNCTETILPDLVQIVNLSLSTGNMDGLKDSVVTPLLKKAGADPEVLANFRPITGISYVGKLIERAVLPQLFQHMFLNRLHIPNQSGYKPGHSCETLLVRLVNDILLNMDDAKCTVLLLLDLSAAFDTVDHDILLDILSGEIGVSDTVLQWLRSFLKGRRQAIIINGVKSGYRDNLFGVPQGSVLGPVLFNIYVRGLIRYLESFGFTVHGYADDHQVLKSFRIEFQFATIRDSLPKCLELISLWMKKFFLKLNAGKSQVIVFTPDSQHSQLLVKRVFLEDGSVLPITSEATNLGMLMDCKLSFGPQIDRVISSCYGLLRNISSIRRYLSKDDIKSLVNSVVVSRIDNCNALYAGLSAYHISRLQRLQNSCARVIYGARRRDHVSPLLRQLHWLPIRQRIIFKVLTLVFKCLRNTAPSYLSDILPETVENRFVRIPRTKTSHGDHAFCRFGPIYWNALPPTLRNIQSISSFKPKLKHYLFSSSLEYFNTLNRYRNWI